MVSSAARIEGGTQNLPASVRKTIQSIKEIVGDHSDTDIYLMLKETNMDPNETTQKLLNQDPFHEVKRKRDKKKESAGNDYSSDQQKHSEVPYSSDQRRHSEVPYSSDQRRHSEVPYSPDQRRHSEVPYSPDQRRHSEVPYSSDQRRHSEVVGQAIKVNTHSDRNIRRGGYARNASPANSGVSREFRVVRDNRVNRNINREVKPVSAASATSTSDNVSGKGSTGSGKSEKPSAGKSLSQVLNGSSDSRLKVVQDTDATGFVRKEAPEEKRVTVPSAASRIQAWKSNNARSQSAMVASSSSAVGVYSSSTDPVHVPSPDSRSSGSVGAIKREVGVVGVRRQSSDNAKSSVLSSSFSNSLLGGEGSAESFRSFTNTNISKNDGPNQTSESMMPSMSVGRALLSGHTHYSNRQQHQQPVGHQKASQPNKEWKPKSSQKPRIPGVIGTPTKSVSPPDNDSKDLESEVAKVEDKLSRVNIHENQNVIIAQHIRVPETDRCRLTFGSFGKEFDPSEDLANGFSGGVVGESNEEPTASLSALDSSIEDASSSKQADMIDEKLRNSGSNSPLSGAASENQLLDKKESSSPRDLDNYADIGLVQDNSQSYDPSESQQQEHPDLPGFSAYDLQSGYDIPYFRPSMDEAIRGQGLQISHEALSSHNANSIPSSTIAMVQQQQQQQPPVAQMYPQVHVSHYANLMPYRQFLSPVYVPPMAMPGYSSNPPFPHPSSGNSFLLVPPGGPHLNANGLKYGVQQFKPVPAGNPTGFGNFSNPNGYAMNTPGVVGGATGLDDSSRLKYKDGNLYVPNPQAETSEMWIQNPRDLSGLPSTPYYNMAGQSPHAAAYLPSHTPHASFNAAAASSHMQFPGLYHPPPQPAMANHHMGPAMGGNVGVSVATAAPGPQAYQQPPLNHLNWTTNF